jgi:outer membrane lipoprotein-sorting protein
LTSWAAVRLTPFFEDQMRSICHSRVACAAIAVIVLAMPAHSAGAQALPSAKALIEKHDAAVGGRAAMDKHTSVHETVAIAIAAANLTGTIDVYHSKPDLFLTKTSLPQGEVIGGYDGKIAWSLTPQGAQLLDSASAAPVRGQADFFGDYYNPARTRTAETIDISDFEGRRCYKVKIVHTDNTESMIYFDSATGLRAGQSDVAKAMGQDVQTMQLMSDYKDFGGVKMPTRRVTRLPMYEVVLTVTLVEFDKVDPAVYALPDAVKALIKP